jgi:hypothetical protein
MTSTINNGIPFVPENAIDPAAGLNMALNQIDPLLQLAVVSVGTNTPPGSPANGARYIVGTAPTGAWAGRANQVAQWLDGAWRFFTTARYALNLADGLWYVRQASAWVSLSGGAPTWGSITGTLSAQTDLQSALDGKVGTGDSRLTDAREWTAETVPQAEAETGTTTTRRAWTAQRVRQAIASWWLTASTAFGRSLATATDAAAGRTALSVREQLTADRTYFVRTDGSDANTGLANTAAAAFLTIQKAIDTAAALDLDVFNVTIRCTGAFTTGATLKSLVGSGLVHIRGDASNLTGFVLSTTNSDCFSMGAGGYAGTYELSFMRLQTASSGVAVRGFGGGGSVIYGNIDFGPCANGHLLAAAGQSFRVSGPITISGSTSAHIFAAAGGAINEANQTITITGSPNFSSAFAVASRAGSIAIASNTYVGGATGARYRADLNGAIFTGGAGETYLPGSSAGVLTTGGQYA